MSEEECIRTSEWVSILDMKTCPYSVQQLDILKEIKQTTGKHIDVVDCSHSSNAGMDICNEVKAFPALCHLRNATEMTCVYGVKSLTDMQESCKKITQQTQS